MPPSIIVRCVRPRAPARRPHVDASAAASAIAAGASSCAACFAAEWHAARTKSARFTRGYYSARRTRELPFFCTARALPSCHVRRELRPVQALRRAVREQRDLRLTVEHALQLEH